MFHLSLLDIVACNISIDTNLPRPAGPGWSSPKRPGSSPGRRPFPHRLGRLLDAAPEALLQRRADRGVKDRFEQEGLDFQKKVREGFLLLANDNPDCIKKVNALQNTDAVQADIQKLLKEAGF